MLFIVSLFNKAKKAVSTLVAYVNMQYLGNICYIIKHIDRTLSVNIYKSILHVLKIHVFM